MNTPFSKCLRPGGFVDLSPRALSLLSLFLLTACGGATDCGCSGFEQRDFPVEHYDKTQAQGVQVRVTETGFGFLEQNAGPLVGELLPGGLNFCLPKNDTADTKLCTPYHTNENGKKKGDQPLCDNGMPGCQLSLTIDKLEIDPVPSRQLDIQITVGDLDEVIPIDAEVKPLGISIRAKCDVKLYKRNDTKAAATVTAKVPVNFNVSPQSPLKDVSIDVGEVSLNLKDLDFDIKGGAACFAADLLRGIFRGSIEGPLRDQLKKVVDEQVRANLCQTCGNMGDDPCPGGTICQDNACIYNNSEQCVPAPLGIEGRLNVGALLQGYTEAAAPNVDLIARAADYAETDAKGLSLALRTGFQPEQYDKCVPVDVTKRPDFGPLPLSQVLKSGVKPGSGEPFMVGLALHRQAIEQVLWAAWAGGGTCLKVGSELSEFLSVQSLSLFLSGLKSLDMGAGGAAEIKVSPQQPPKVTLGKNLFEKQGDTFKVREGLMTIDWKDVDLHMYGWVHDRWTRLATLRVDLLIPIGLIPDGTGKLSLVVGELGDAVKNVRAFDGEITQATPEQLAMLVPTLVGAALPSLAGALEQSFDLPSFFGLTLDLQQGDITSIENDTFVALFGNLVPAPAMPTSAPWDATFAPRLQIDDHRVIYPAGPEIEGVQQPYVILDAQAVSPGYPGAFEETLMQVSWRVDGGLWTSWRQFGEIRRIESPSFMLPGQHAVELRLRAEGARDFLTSTLAVSIDYQAPELRLSYDERAQRLQAVAQDMTDRASSLRFRHKIHDGTGATLWSSWSKKADVDLNTPEKGAVRVEVQVADQSGKVTTQDYTVYAKVAASKDALEDGDSAGQDPQAGGCSSAGSGPGSAPTLLLLLLGSLGLGLRRRAGLLAIFGLLSAAGCSSDNVGKTPNIVEDTCKDACPAGQVCRAGACEVVPGSCTTPQDCVSTCGEKIPACNDQGMCMCTVACEGGCGEGQFCCHVQNVCQEIPDACDGKVCDPGFEPRQGIAGTPDPTTCQLQGASCECVKSEPLPLRFHGAFASLAAFNGKTMLSVYNSSYGDLMVGEIPASGGEIQWQFVAGVPDTGKRDGATDGPRGGISTPGEDMGRYTATVFDASGNLHVFFQDVRNKKLLVATGKPGAQGFDFTVTPVETEGETGFWTGAVLGADGTIHLATHVRVVEADGKRVSQLRTMTFTPEPSGTLTKTSDDVLAQGPAVAADATAPRKEGEEVGGFLDLSVSGEELLLTFYDGQENRVGWSRLGKDATAWSKPQYLGAGTGPYSSGMVAADGAVHLAYMTQSPDTLSYRVTGSGSKAQVIADSLRDTGTVRYTARVGEGVRLRLGADGKPVVIYQDASLHKLMSARLTEGAWKVTEAAAPGSPYSGAHGFYGVMLRGPEASSLLVEYVIDGSTRPATAAPALTTLP